MKSTLMGWVFRAAFGLIVGAVGISIATEQARADSCSGTTIRRLPDCGLLKQQADFDLDE